MTRSATADAEQRVRILARAVYEHAIRMKVTPWAEPFELIDTLIRDADMDELRLVGRSIAGDARARMSTRLELAATNLSDAAASYRTSSSPRHVVAIRAAEHWLRELDRPTYLMDGLVVCARHDRGYQGVVQGPSTRDGCVRVLWEREPETDNHVLSVIGKVTDQDVASVIPLDCGGVEVSTQMGEGRGSAVEAARMRLVRRLERFTKDAEAAGFTLVADASTSVIYVVTQEECAASGLGLRSAKRHAYIGPKSGRGASS